MWQASGQDTSRLRAQGNHVFVSGCSHEARLVFTVENGRATRVTLRQNGSEFTGERTP